MRVVKWLLRLGALAIVVTVAAAVFIGLGVYDVAADDPHGSVTQRVLEAARTKSIERRARNIDVPPLDDPAMIRAGAGNYAAMCVSCHLAPGASDTELSLGLNPAPPTWQELGQVDPRVAFWAMKHGIKMSGMPAWGRSMEDEYLWGMVALLQQFPKMTAAEYGALVAASPGHSHGGAETDVAGGDAPPGTDAPRSSPEPIDDPTREGSGDEHDEADAHAPDHDH